MKLEDGVITFETGKTIEANGGIIGLGPDCNVYEGYDGDLFDPMFFRNPDPFISTLTSQECVELADYMVQAWQRFREQAWQGFPEGAK